jgi:hypothetical protein
MSLYNECTFTQIRNLNMFYIRGGVQPSNIFVDVKTVPSCCLIALLAYKKKLKHFKEKNVSKKSPGIYNREV